MFRVFDDSTWLYRCSSVILRALFRVFKSIAREALPRPPGFSGVKKRPPGSGRWFLQGTRWADPSRQRGLVAGGPAGRPAGREGQGPPGTPGVMLRLLERPLGRGELASILSRPQRCE